MGSTSLREACGHAGDEVASYRAVGVERGVEDRDGHPHGATGGEEDLQQLAQLGEAQPALHPVIYGGHDLVVQDVGVEVDPEPRELVYEQVAYRRPGGLLELRGPRLREVEDVDGRLPDVSAALRGRPLGVTVAEHDDVFVPDERPQPVDVSAQVWPPAGHYPELNLGYLPRSRRLGLVEVGVAVGEEQTVPAARAPQGEEAADKDAAVAPE